MDFQRYNVKIQNENFGILLDEYFANQSQFKLFLKAVKGCLELKYDLTFYNGNDFLIHIPSDKLAQSIIIARTESPLTLKDYMIEKSKIEALKTKD
jgi:hypothetical protein